MPQDTPFDAPHFAATPGEEAPGASRAAASPPAAGDAAPAGLALSNTGGADGATRALLEQLIATIGNSSQDTEEEKRANQRWEIRAYLTAMRRRARPMLLSGLLVAAAVSFRLRPTDIQYSATAVMLLPFKTPVAASQDPTGLFGSFMQASMPNNIQTQIAILTSPNLVAQAIGRLTPQERILGWKSANVDDGVLGAKVQAVQGQSTDLINLTVTANDQKVAVKLANQLMDTFADRTTALATQSNQKGLKLINNQVHQSYLLMVQAKDELKRFKEKTGILVLDTRLATDAATMQDLTAKAQRAREASQAGMADPSVQSDETRNTLNLALQAAREKYQATQKDFLPTAPEAQKVAREVREAQAALNLRTQALLSINRSRMHDTQVALETQKNVMKNLPETEVKLGQLQDKVDLLTATYKTVYDRYTALTLGQSSQVDTATPLVTADRALLSSRTWPMILAVGLLCGLAVSILVAAVLESLDHSLHDSEELRELLDAPVLGALPLLRAGGEQRLPRLQPSDPATASVLEACRLLRANLYFAGEGGLSSVLITSANPGEGKSLTAYNLATAIALDGRSVLLLDCDLRRPTQHLLAEIPLEPGLVNLLNPGLVNLVSGNVDFGRDLQAALRPGGVNNMWLLTAGALTGSPPELLGSANNRRLIAELESRFDLVIIDSPPVLSLADAQVLSSLADGVLLVVAADQTPSENVRRAELMLRHAGARILGTILNKARDTGNLYGRHYYSGAGALPAFGPATGSQHGAGNGQGNKAESTPKGRTR